MQWEKKKKKKTGLVSTVFLYSVKYIMFLYFE